jgi:ribosomal protein L18, bacterial type
MKMTKEESRARRKVRIRKKISGSAERPRLVVFRSNRQIYAQLIDDIAGRTLASSSTLALGQGWRDGEAESGVRRQGGKDIAAKALAGGIEMVVFDRNGYLYHGRIKALAEGAREGGLKF